MSARAFFSSNAVKKLDIGVRLRLVRAFFRLKRADLAKALDIGERSLRAYETGTRSPSPAMEAKLRRFLDSESTWSRKVARLA